MIAVVFPGQGVTPPWVDISVLGRPPVRDRLAIASEATGVDLQQLLRRGGRELARTEILQPALVAVCLGVFRLHAIQPDVVAGHSLGELTAWAASGAISDRDAIVIAALRGRLMAAAARRRPGAMIALRDPGASARALAHPEVWLAAHNAPDEHVVSGERAAIAKLERELSAVRLPVAGAWHSPLMADAVDELSAALHRVSRRSGVPVVANRTGAIAEPDTLPDLLAQQLVSPIEWVTAQHTLAGLTRRWLAIGPGSVVRGLARRTVPEVTVEIVRSEPEARHEVA